MTIEDENRRENHYEERSKMQMLAEIGRLLMVLLGKKLKKLWQYVKKFFRSLLVLVCKGLIALIDLTNNVIRRFRSFWNDNDTQAKVRKMKLTLKLWTRRLGRWCVKGLIQTWKGLKWLGVHLWTGVVWLTKKTIEGLIHMRPTLVKGWKLLKQGLRATWRGIVACSRAFIAWLRGRYEAYRRFRKNKGFKGLLIDIGNGLKHSVNSYMDEEQNEEENVKEEDDENMETEIDTYFYESALPENSRVHSWGKRLYDAMKRIVEV